MPSVWNSPRRIEVAEQMDSPDVDGRELGGALKFIRRVNAWLGYTRSTLVHLERLTQSLPADRPLRVLDVATGSADVPLAIAGWAKRRGRKVEVVGLDLHSETLLQAAALAPGIPLVRGDALNLPFADKEFDVVMTSMFLHHLPSDLVVRVLSEMRRVAGHAVIAADLVRNRRAYAWISLFTALSPPMIRHDARVSVRQAFTFAEIDELRRAAGLHGAKVYRHFGHRLVLAGPVGEG